MSNLTLSFNGTTKTLTPIDVDGKTMFDLNEIWREWGLGKKSAPSQWRGKERASFESSANLQSMNGKGGSTLATQPAVYAYAMWVSTEFFMAVVQCFTAVVNGDVALATTIAKGVSRVDVHAAIKMQRPRYRIREFLDKHPTLVAGVTDILANMANAQNVTREDRERFTQSIRDEVRIRFLEGKDKSEDSGELYDLIHDSERALRMLAEKERFWARGAATRNNGGY